MGEALERSARVREDELVAEALFLSEPRLTVLQDDRIAVTLMLDAFLAPTEPGVLDVIDFAIDRTVNDARSALQPANADGAAPARVSFPV